MVNTRAEERSKTTPTESAAAVAEGASATPDIMDVARQAFEEKKLRFTDLRQQVFSEIAAIRGSIGAYEILDRLSEKGTRLAPISVYRSIDALMEAGVIHRLESKNAYFACRRHEHGRRGRPIFLVCEHCGGVTEAAAQDVFDRIREIAVEAGFKPKVKFVEVSGTCADCISEAGETGGPSGER